MIWFICTGTIASHGGGGMGNMGVGFLIAQGVSFRRVDAQAVATACVIDQPTDNASQESPASAGRFLRSQRHRVVEIEECYGTVARATKHAAGIRFQLRPQ